VDEIYWKFNKEARRKAVDEYAKVHGLYLVAGFAQNIKCDFSSGTKIRLNTIRTRDRKKFFSLERVLRYE